MLSTLLLAWYDRNRRVLPFRGVRDPYRIWISEIMLQQTRTETVGAYYQRFLKRFPDVFALAGAEEVLVPRCSAVTTWVVETCLRRKMFLVPRVTCPWTRPQMRLVLERLPLMLEVTMQALAR